MDTKFKVGDVVRVKKDSGGWYFPSKHKRLGVVIFINPDEDDPYYPYLVFTVGGDGEEHIWVYGEDELKLVTSRADILLKAYSIVENADED